MEPRPQYQFDNSGLAGKPVEGWQRNDHDANGAPLGLHDETLYDQDEDRAGNLHNLATGNRFDNSTYTGQEDLGVVDVNGHHPDGHEDILPPLKDAIEQDAAAAWLAEHDPDKKL